MIGAWAPRRGYLDVMGTARGSVEVDRGVWRGYGDVGGRAVPDCTADEARRRATGRRAPWEAGADPSTGAGARLGFAPHRCGERHGLPAAAAGPRGDVRGPRRPRDGRGRRRGGRIALAVRL